MKYRVYLFSLAMLCLIAVATASDAEKQAEDAALAWLALVDARQYEASWKETASLFRAQVTVKQWSHAVSAARKPFGKLKSRQLKDAKYTTNLPGAPDGEYVVLQFEAVYEHKASAIETVTPMQDDGTWRVSGYYIR